MADLSKNKLDTQPSKEWKIGVIGKPDPDYLVNMVFKQMIQEIIGGVNNEDRSSV